MRLDGPRPILESWRPMSALNRGKPLNLVEGNPLHTGPLIHSGHEDIIAEISSLTNRCSCMHRHRPVILARNVGCGHHLVG